MPCSSLGYCRCARVFNTVCEGMISPYACARMYQYALKGLTCRAYVTPASSPAVPASRVRRSRHLLAKRAAAPVLFAPAFCPCHMEITVDLGVANALFGHCTERCLCVSDCFCHKRGTLSTRARQGNLIVAQPLTVVALCSDVDLNAGCSFAVIKHITSQAARQC